MMALRIGAFHWQVVTSTDVLHVKKKPTWHLCVKTVCLKMEACTIPVYPQNTAAVCRGAQPPSAE